MAFNGIIQIHSNISSYLFSVFTMNFFFSFKKISSESGSLLKKHDSCSCLAAAGKDLETVMETVMEAAAEALMEAVEVTKAPAREQRRAAVESSNGMY